MFDGAQGTTRVVQRAADHVARWDDTTRAEAHQAAAVLMVNCPYNRLSMQLPIALERVAARYDDSYTDIEFRAEWRRIRAGLAQHVALVDALGAGAQPMPQPGDYLAPHRQLLLTRAQLDASADPLDALEPLLNATHGLVGSYDPWTLQRIADATDTVDLRTDGQWPTQYLLMAWRRQLVSIEPFITQQDMLRDVQRMIAALDTYSELRC
jgi:hypothetical protein